MEDYKYLIRRQAAINNPLHECRWREVFLCTCGCSHERGADSSVAAAVLVEKGYDVIVATMKI